MSGNEKINIKSVCSVLVMHLPDRELLKRLPKILAQCGHIVLANNGCESSMLAEIKQLVVAQPSALSLIHSPENNLAMAQNLGIRHARDHKYTFILLLDQDSEPADGMVERLLAAYEADERPQRAGIIAPHMIDTQTSREHYYVTPWLGVGLRRLHASLDKVLKPVLWVIASGSLIPVARFDEVGLMDESYGIDYVDKEFCLRLVSRGYIISVVSDAVLRHQIGHCSDHDMLGIRITATNHPPRRRYTIYRNRLRTCGRYGLCVPAFLLYECGGIFYDLTRIALFEQDKMAKLKAVLAGAYDAATGGNTWKD